MAWRIWIRVLCTLAISQGIAANSCRFFDVVNKEVIKDGLRVRTGSLRLKGTSKDELKFQLSSTVEDLTVYGFRQQFKRSLNSNYFYRQYKNADESKINYRMVYKRESKPEFSYIKLGEFDCGKKDESQPLKVASDQSEERKVTIAKAKNNDSLKRKLIEDRKLVQRLKDEVEHLKIDLVRKEFILPKNIRQSDKRQASSCKAIDQILQSWNSGRNGILKLSVSSNRRFTITLPTAGNLNIYFANQVSCTGQTCIYQVANWVTNQGGFWELGYTWKGPDTKFESVKVNGEKCSSDEPPQPTPPQGGSFDCKDFIRKLQSGSSQIRFRLRIQHVESTATPIVITFNKRVGHLHTSAGNMQSSNGNKQFSLRLQRWMASRETKNIEFTGNYNQRRRPKVVSVTYGTWSCKSGVKPTTISPITLGGAKCDAFQQVTQKQSNGEQGRLNIPVAKDLSGWYIQVGFDNPITNFHFVEGHEPSKDCNNIYTFQSPAHKESLSAGTTLTSQYSFHYPQNGDKAKISYIKFGDEESSSECGSKPPSCPTTQPVVTTKPTTVATEATTTDEATTTEEATTTDEATTTEEIVTTEQPTTTETITDGSTTTEILKTESTTDQVSTMTISSTDSTSIQSTLTPTQNPSTTMKSSTASPPITLGGSECDPFIQVKYPQANGQVGEIYLKVPTELNAWSLEIGFDSPITSMNLVAAQPDSNNDCMTLFTRQHYDYNKDLAAGSTFSTQYSFYYSQEDSTSVSKITYLRLFSDTSSAQCGVKPPDCPTTSPKTEKTSTSESAPTTGTLMSTTEFPQTTESTSSESPQTTESTSSEPPTTTDNTITIVSTVTDSATVKPTTCATPYDYSDVIHKSLLFYEAQRSGDLPDSNRIPWRYDSALQDGSDVGKDLTGGYYDAGDFVKFGLPMASTVTLLAWGMVLFADGYKQAGEYENGLAAIKWGTDYFIKCHTDTNEFYGQVGIGEIDHKTWGRDIDINQLPSQRKSFVLNTAKPGSEVAGETAAALAAASIVFKTKDEAYSAELLRHSKELFNFGRIYQGKYSDSIPDAGKFYNSYSGYNDELAWGAAWLAKATGEQSYIDQAEQFAASMGYPNELSWDNKWRGVQIMLADLTKKSIYLDAVKGFCDNLESRQKRTPQGMVFIQQWGSNRHAANVAFACLAASRLLDDIDYSDFSKQQIGLMLGDAGRSYMVGFGVNPPKRPHHSGSSCPDLPASCGWDQLNTGDANPQILYGALVGGPGEDGSYADVRTDYVKNEVATDYNAGFQSAVAGLLTLATEGKCP